MSECFGARACPRVFVLVCVFLSDIANETFSFFIPSHHGIHATLDAQEAAIKSVGLASARRLVAEADSYTARSGKLYNLLQRVGVTPPQPKRLLREEAYKGAQEYVEGRVLWERGEGEEGVWIERAVEAAVRCAFGFRVWGLGFRGVRELSRLQ